jgi:uncharacterized membrane protein
MSLGVFRENPYHSLIFRPPFNLKAILGSMVGVGIGVGGGVGIFGVRVGVIGVGVGPKLS